MISRFAVVGNPIAHSLSPVIHLQFAEQFAINLSYDKILGDEANFEAQVINFFAQGGKGLNITLPFKQRAFAMAAVTTPRCAQAGAANTLWMQEGQLHADNTDGIGLITDLQHHVQLVNKKILILGAGGAARGVISPLLDAGIDTLSLTNRTLAKAQALSNDFPRLQVIAFNELKSPIDVLINATSASLGDESVEIPEVIFSNKPFCYDLAYKKTGNTPFVNLAAQHGCNAADGLGMLVEQAAVAFSIWHGRTPETKYIQELLQGR